MQEAAKVKYASDRMGVRSSKPDFDLDCRGVLATILSITGWDMPNDNVRSGAIYSQFMIYCADNCRDLTPEEIVYSVRKYGLDIKDWGKAINLQLIDEPIRRYREVRAELSCLESIKATSDVQTSIEQGPVDWSDVLENIRVNGVPEAYADFVPWATLFDFLHRTGKMSLEETIIEKIRSEARNYLISKLEIKRASFKATPDERAELERLRCIDWATDDKVKSFIRTTCKMIAVKYHLFGEQTLYNKNSII